MSGVTRRRQRGVVRRFAASAASLVLMTWASTALAQASESADFALERMRPGLSRASLLAIEPATLDARGSYDAALWFDYGQNELMLSLDGSRSGDLVGERMSAHLVSAYTLHERLQLGLDLPVVLYQGRNDPPPTSVATLGNLRSSGVGDLRLVAKAALLDHSVALVDVGAQAALTLPTGTPAGSYLGDRGLTVLPELLVSRPFGSLTLAVNVGYLWRRQIQFLNLKVGPEVTYGVGGRYDLETLTRLPLEAVVTLDGATSALRPTANVNRNPLEMRAALAYEVRPQWSLLVGAGVGVVAGFGTPDARVFTVLRWQPDAPPPPQVSLGSSRIDIRDTVHFDTGKATIQPRSYGLLREVAKIILDNADIHHLRIEGHTDNVGGAKYNRELSQARAEAVRDFLVRAGVEPHILEAQGFGDSQPVAPNSTERGRARNRRVEFVIVQR